MSDYRIVPVENTSYQVVGNGASSVSPAAAPQQQVQNVQGAEASQAPAGQLPKPAVQEPEKAKDSLPVSNNSDVSLKFQIDEETHNITVYIIDRASNRVLRSIPPQEINKLKAGDLLQMLA